MSLKTNSSSPNSFLNYIIFAALKSQNRVMSKDPLMKEEVPMVKINGPSIQLPSFSLVSDQLKLFPNDQEKAEQRTASIGRYNIFKNIIIMEILEKMSKCLSL